MINEMVKDGMVNAMAKEVVVSAQNGLLTKVQWCVSFYIT